MPKSTTPPRPFRQVMDGKGSQRLQCGACFSNLMPLTPEWRIPDDAEWGCDNACCRWFLVPVYPVKLDV
jgi:hypothetical protein